MALTLIILIEPWLLLRNIYIKPPSIPAPGGCLLHNHGRGPRLNKYDLSVLFVRIVLVDRKTDGFQDEICLEWKTDKQK